MNQPQIRYGAGPAATTVSVGSFTNRNENIVIKKALLTPKQYCFYYYANQLESLDSNHFGKAAAASFNNCSHK